MLRDFLFPKQIEGNAFRDYAHLGRPALEVERPEVEGELCDLLVVAEAPVDLVPLAQPLHLLHLSRPKLQDYYWKYC